jgi:hypothetical protein
LNKLPFEQRFLEIVKLEPNQFHYPDAAKLLIEIIKGHADSEDMTFDEAANDLSNSPNYGDCSGIAGGVNVYRFLNGEVAEEFTRSDDSTWMSLEQLVTAVDEGIWQWFDADWIKVLDE